MLLIVNGDVFMGWYELKLSNSGQHYFVLKAGNGEGILTSEMYNSRASAENGIASVQSNSPERANYDLKPAVNGKWRFNLKAKNHQIIGVSQMYATESSAENGIASVQSNGPSQTVKDLTN
ncbi:YegP family protein [Aeromonas veronii]|uniref:YegP family protein n=1 Tax=Aeromonas veronii TaxID=654 RepID=UPI003D1C1AFA